MMMRVSVVIPTYNRCSSLESLLKALDREDYPRSHLEVIVVDDGSSDGTQVLLGNSYSFQLRSFYQENQGDATARNLGCLKATGELLIFIDDDCQIALGVLQSMVDSHGGRQKLIVVGNLLLKPPKDSTVFGKVFSSSLHTINESSGVSFADCSSTLFCIRREDYLKLGMMKSLRDGSGSSLWCDVEFGFRAYLKGFRFERQEGEKSFHVYEHLRDLKSYCRRASDSAKTAVMLFSEHPGLSQELKMFTDKTPIDWKRDQYKLVLRKIMRQLSSHKAAVSFMEGLARWIEKWSPNPELLQLIYDCLVGSYLVLGLRKGLKGLASGKECQPS